MQSFMYLDQNILCQSQNWNYKGYETPRRAYKGLNGHYIIWCPNRKVVFMREIN